MSDMTIGGVPVWLVFALISPLFFGIVHVFDAYCVDEIFEQPWMGAVTSGLSMLVLCPVLALGLGFVSLTPMSVGAISWCALAGVVFMVGHIAYFQALAFSESGIVSAYWDMIPLFLLPLGYIIFDERLTTIQYVGCVVLVFASVNFCLLDGHLETRLQAFLLMIFGAICYSGYFLIQKYLFDRYPVYQTFIAITFFMGIAGLLPLMLPKNRQMFRQNRKVLSEKFGLLLGLETVNLVGVATGQYAVSYGSPSLVAAVDSTIAAYTFLISMSLYAVFGKYGEAEAKENLPRKLLLVAVMAVGVWLVS